MNLKSVLFAAVGILALVANVQAEEKVVATVNGIPVLESQVQGALNKKTNNRQAALNKVIDDILVDQAVQESGVKVNNAQVDKIIEGIAAQNGLTFGQLLDALA